MNRRKKSINTSIFLSHLATILIFMILTAVIFDLALEIYVRRETRNQILATGQVVREAIVKDPSILNGDQLGEVGKNTSGKLKLSLILRKANSVLDIKYFVINESKEIIDSNFANEKDEQRIADEIINKIKKNQLSDLVRSKVFNININGNKYQAVSYPIKIKDTSGRYLIVYSDLSRSDEITRKVNFLLLSILIITAAISMYISTKLSKKISNPIYEVIKYAKSIADRNYSSRTFNYEHEELRDLSNTMNFMAQKLSLYDDTMKIFVQNASHELRTPLMSIQGYAEAIKFEVVEDKDKAIDIIIEESKRLSNIVEDLLYLTKIDTMQDSFNIEKVNLKELTKDSIDRVKGITLHNEKDILFQCDEEVVFIDGDEEKLRRAIINILANCIRYSNEKVQILLNKREQEIVIIINDDGPGFDETEKSHIFERFFKGKGGNYGLGLAITKTIIEKHNGTIRADNHVHGGACFTIMFKQ